jgi:hypothetical protein
MIMAGVETLISTATKIAKKEEQDGRRRIEPVGVQPDDTSKQLHYPMVPSCRVISPL